MRGQQLFFGKAKCGRSYTDNLMHNLKTERFFKAHLINE